MLTSAWELGSRWHIDTRVTLIGGYKSIACHYPIHSHHSQPWVNVGCWVVQEVHLVPLQRKGEESNGFWKKKYKYVTLVQAHAIAIVATNRFKAKCIKHLNIARKSIEAEAAIFVTTLDASRLYDDTGEHAFIMHTNLSPYIRFPRADILFTSRSTCMVIIFL